MVQTVVLVVALLETQLQQVQAVQEAQEIRQAFRHHKEATAAKHIQTI